jgi:hypothetical protein
MKAAFQLALPGEFKEGKFGRYEVVDHTCFD